MATYTAEVIKDLSITTPTEGATPPSEMNDSVREVKRVIKNNNALAYKTGNYTLTAQDSVVRVNGSYSITLPDPSTVASATFTKYYTIRATSGTTTIIGTVDTVTNPTIPNGYSMTIFTNGTVWNEIKQQSTGMLDDVLPDDLLIKDSVTNLIIVNTDSFEDTRLTITADEIILHDDTNNKVLKLNNINKVVDITTSGAGGLDTGTEANSTWYNVFIIRNQTTTTTTTLLSTSSTSPVMPSGYTYKALVGCVFNDGTGNFIRMFQKGARCDAVLRNVISAGTATTPTAIPLVNFAPPIVRTVFGRWWVHYVSASKYAVLYIDKYSTEINPHKLISSTAAAIDVGGRWELNLTTRATDIKYYIEAAGIEVTVDVSGWTIRNLSGG